MSAPKDWIVARVFRCSYNPGLITIAGTNNCTGGTEFVWNFEPRFLKPFDRYDFSDAVIDADVAHYFTDSTKGD